MQTVREVLFDVMRHLGMTKDFGNIGSTEEKLLGSFPPDFGYILSLHESVAVARADAYSQASGKPFHVNLHTAAGSGNGVGSITTAWHNRTPMVITAGQQTLEMLLIEPYLTNKSPLVELVPWVNWACEPTRSEDVPAAFLRATLWRFNRLPVRCTCRSQWTTWTNRAPIRLAPDWYMPVSRHLRMS